MILDLAIIYMINPVIIAMIVVIGNWALNAVISGSSWCMTNGIR